MTNIIASMIVPESQRMNVADKHFGIRYPLVVEPMVYQFATQLLEFPSTQQWWILHVAKAG
jgi:hypothetical protein